MAKHQARRKHLSLDTFELYLGSVVVLLTLGTLCTAENPWHKRDRSDAEMWPYVVKQVASDADAVEYLREYWGLNCSTTTSEKLTTVFEREPVIMEDRSNPHETGGCTQEQIHAALLDFQKYYSIPHSSTGNLDENTKKYMNMYRCGNSDVGALPVKSNNKPSENAGQNRSTKKVRRSVYDLIKAGIEQKPHARQRRASTGTHDDPHEYVYDSSYAKSRRKRMIEDFRRKLEEDPIIDHKEVPIVARDPSHRTRRSVQSNDDLPRKFQNSLIGYKVEVLDTRVPLLEARAIMKLVTRMWSEVIPMTFVEADTLSASEANILVEFKRGHHNCKMSFDGPGRSLAHSFSGGDIHFDDDERWKLGGSKKLGEVDMLPVALHEMGHVLGLPHNNRVNSVMYAFYLNIYNAQEDFELQRFDRDQVQQVYGICKGKFDGVIDWVRQHQWNGKWLYNTYFFRDGSYWMYENAANRTRYGDPLLISKGWEGVPNKIDAHAQVYIPARSGWTMYTYFFAANKVYYFALDESGAIWEYRVHKDYPKDIKEVFRPKNASLDADKIPNNLDATFFDYLRSTLYFFKGDQVWGYNINGHTEQGGECCNFQANFSSVFPMLEGETEILLGNVDTVYRSHFNRTMYFFKDDNVWENINLYSMKPYKLKYIGKWYDIWRDICDA